MTDLMPMMDAYKVLMSNIAKFAEANGAELDYIDEGTYYDSVRQWYGNYVQAKHEESKYDEYIEVINDIMFEIMSRLTIDKDATAWLPEDDITLRDDDGSEYGRFYIHNQETEGTLTIRITDEVKTKNGNPFFEIESQQKPAVLECPDEVIQILEDNGITIEIISQGYNGFEINTPFFANAHKEEE